MTAISTIRNLGPAMEAQLNAASIPTAEALQACGADEAYRRLLRSGARPHFIAYYVLHMPLQSRPWNDCKGAEKLPCAEISTRWSPSTGASTNTALKKS
jgi:hypothetical protein